MQNPIVSLYYSFPMCPMWFKHNSEVEKTFFEGYAENIVPNVDYQGKQDDLESKLVLNNELLNVGWYRETRGRIPSQHIKHYLRSKEYGGLSGNNPWGNDDSSSSDNNQSQNAEDKQYYFHPDHLGSTNYLTDVTGEAYQHVAYLPWGEVFVEERNTQTSRNTFLYTGKELDEMTGLYYYEQRYYDPGKSYFLGVDQLTDKYPHISGFAYVANNPLILVDPDGREPIKPYVGTASMFRELLNNSPRGVGNYVGAQAGNYLSSLSNTKFSWKQMRPLPTQTGYFNKKAGRYIYTEKGGWIDMTHFMFYAGKAYNYKQRKQRAQGIMNSKSFKYMRYGQEIIIKQATMDPVGEAVQDGYYQEMSDSFVAKHSAYSYEDLPSDKYGADFGANYFDPNSELTFGEQLENYLNGLGATDPENAPNYNKLPLSETTNNPTRINKTTTPVYTKENP